jgi:hemerythrin
MLEPIQWNDNFKVGVVIIDKQHEKLFASFNKLTGLLHDKIKVIDLEDILDDMIDYLKFHFKTEEKLLKKHPDFQIHKNKHLEFIAKTKEFDENFLDKNPEIVANEMFIFLSGWLKKHIQEEDKFYFQYLITKNLLPDQP